MWRIERAACLALLMRTVERLLIQHTDARLWLCRAVLQFRMSTPVASDLLMLSIILGFVTGLAGPIATAVGKITDLKTARVKADSDQERAKIDAEIEEAQGRKAVMVAEAGNRIAGAINATMRAGLALGPVAYVLKYYLWDKVIGAFAGCASLPRGVNPPHCKTFTTDPLNTEMAAVLTAVIAFYLLYDLTARHRKR